MAHIDKDDEDEENIESVNVPLWEDIYYEEDGNDW